MSHEALMDLEQNVDNLIERYNQLRQENLSLRQSLSRISEERDKLSSLQKAAATHVKKVISQLKEETV